MKLKSAALPGSPVSSTPSLQIPTTPAPGLRGPGSKNGGMAPRQTFAPVNTAVPTAPLGGALEQKSMQPPNPRMPAALAPAPMMKLNSVKGNEGYMATAIGTRPHRLQDMLKTAMAESANKVNISLEAARQLEEPSDEKVASAGDSDSVDLDYALKLASAVEMIADEFGKSASDMGGSYGLSESHVGPGKGPGALHVLEAEASTRFPEHQGQGHAVVPMRTGTEKVHPAEHGGTANETNDKNPAGFHSTQTTAMTAGKGKVAGVKTGGEKCAKCDKEGDKCECPKTAAAKIKAAFAKVAEDAEKKETEGMAAAKKGLAKAEKAHESEPENKEASGFGALARHMRAQTGAVKVAEDAINPAKISAGAAVPPDTSASGESGGNPVGGAPQGPTSLVGSNESAINYKRNAAHSPRKAELKEYFNEPALSSATDKTLSEAFAHTSEAGTKFGSAGATKVAAAKAVIAKLAEEAEQNAASQRASGQPA